MKKLDVPYIKNIVTEVAEIQAPRDIDPDNTDLNGKEVSQYLTNGDNEVIFNLKSIINETRITELGNIHQQDKNILSSAGVVITEARNPEQPYTVYITAAIPTTESKSMPDNYGTHKSTVKRDIGS